MKKSISVFYGLLITIIIYGIGVYAANYLNFNGDFIPSSFFMHSILLVLSLVAIIVFSKYNLIKFPFQKVKFKYYIYGILIALLGFIIAQILATVILNIFGFHISANGKGHPLITELNPLQFFLFILIYASICEEFLFRGFSQNFLSPLKSIGIRISKEVFISLPVIIGGIVFGLAHLILLTAGATGPYVFRIVLITSIIGIIAGYFQEKHQNILPAIAVHMASNLPGLIIILFM